LLDHAAGAALAKDLGASEHAVTASCQPRDPLVERSMCHENTYVVV
jgi:hypothetical protein